MNVKKYFLMSILLLAFYQSKGELKLPFFITTLLACSAFAFGAGYFYKEKKIEEIQKRVQDGTLCSFCSELDCSLHGGQKINKK